MAEARSGVILKELDMSMSAPVSVSIFGSGRNDCGHTQVTQSLEDLPRERIALMCLDVAVAGPPRITVTSPQLSKQCVYSSGIRCMSG